MSKNNVLERIVVHKDKTFLHGGDKRTDAYIVQDGVIASYVVENGHKMEISRYSAGSIIAETNLLMDEPCTYNYEAITKATLVKITRQDFEKKLVRYDTTVIKVIKHLLQKLEDQEKRWMNFMAKAKQNDIKAMEIVSHLLRDVKAEKKGKYEEILLPQFNIMVKALEDIRREERHARQRKSLDDTITKAKSNSEEKTAV